MDQDVIIENLYILMEEHLDFQKKVLLEDVIVYLYRNVQIQKIIVYVENDKTYNSWLI